MYNRGLRGSQLFHLDQQYGLFLETARDTLSAGIEIHALCLMPNHFHLAVFLREACEVSAWLQRWLTRFGRIYRSKWNVEGLLWGSRIHSKELSSEIALARVVEYIHQNPVQAGLSGSPEEWRWSSACPALRAEHPWIGAERLDEPG